MTAMTRRLTEWSQTQAGSTTPARSLTWHRPLLLLIVLMGFAGAYLWLARRGEEG